MISAWWLFLIVPTSFVGGFFIAALLSVGKDNK